MAAEGLANAIQKIGRYRITGQLGRGGMGVVYQAEDELIGRQVAIKTLTEVTPELRERFSIEAKSGILSHSNIVTVYELGEHEGNPFIAMEFVEGESLEQVLQNRKRLPLLEAVSIVKQLCAGLGYAHGHGVVHRDIKPANVLVRPDGRVTIVDFGIARLADQTRQLTKADTLLGTFHYMAPERLKGEASDGRSDIWSIGVMLYEMLAGELPFKGSDVSSLYRVIHEPYIPLTEYVQGFPGELGRVFDKALAKQVDDSYATAEEMSFDLQVLVKELDQDPVVISLASTRQQTEERLLSDSAHTVRLQTLRTGPSSAGTKVLPSESRDREILVSDQDDKTRVLTTVPDPELLLRFQEEEEGKKREFDIQKVVRSAVLEAQELLPDHPEQALQVLEAALKRAPDSNTLAQPKARLLEHQLLGNISDYRDAMKQADALIHSGDLQGAEQKYQVAIRLLQNGPGQPQERLLEVQTAEAQSAKAQPQTSKLTPASPQKKATATVRPVKANSDKVRDSLDAAHRAEAQGDFKAALYAYEAALQLDKKQEEAIDGKKRVLEEMQEGPKAVEDNLVAGVSDFYASHFSQANDEINMYLQRGGKRFAGSAHFYLYLGASLLTEAILTPAKDQVQGDALRRQAQGQFVLDRKLHYKPMKLAVSPKILVQWIQAGDQR